MSLIQIGNGQVFHSRKEGAANRFNYSAFFLHFRCDQDAELQKHMRDRFRRALWFTSVDYLKGKAGDLDLLVKDFLREFCGYEAEEVWLHTLPRMLGYVFNPVSFWLCRRGGNLEAVLVEVSNTFGEKHFYWIQPPLGISADEWYRAEKVFHVSPFFPVEGFYQFRFDVATSDARIEINYHGPSGALRLATSVQGQLSPLQNYSAAMLFRRYGWMTAMVVLRVHFQALKLWLKKSHFYSKPALPREEVSS